MKKKLLPGLCSNIEIDNLNSKGEGVGRIDNLVVFVPQAVPGDYLEVEILHSKKNYSLAKIKKILTPSSYRVTPLCPHFEDCGGCSIQHIKYDCQLTLKHQILKENLRKIAGISPDTVSEIKGSPIKWHYRNKVQQVVSKSHKGTIKTGFFRRHSHDVVNINECFIQHEIANRLMRKLFRLISFGNWSVYNEKKHSGLLRYIVLKVSFSRKEVLCIFVTTEGTIPQKNEFINSLKEFPGLVGIVQNINTRRANTIMGTRDVLLWGRNHIIENIKGIDFKITPTSFFQVNVFQLETLMDMISEVINPLEINSVLDAYCGTGTFSLLLSSRVKKIRGIEENPDAVKMAKKNAKINNLKNVEFFCGKVEDLISRAGKKDNFDMIILDPPRKGCDRNVLETINKMDLKHIIYISCNPSTLARDLSLLEDMGYRAEKIQPVDMFPHTSHIETFCYLNK